MGSEVIVIGDVLAKSLLQGIDRERNDPSSDLPSGGADEPLDEGVAARAARRCPSDLASDRPEALLRWVSEQGIAINDNGSGVL